ncbi:protein-L-isoaspartate(D-aspartate) O-methyltransferase [Thiohalocapsa marina]|uniref:Protein-L-isoaspartate O-methyltransferase n=2 Tax=Thiohalocapsa marina TaxID=424902 RepID=A0A5M8FVV9_9GAMM|nr:protein-L-isoaspartate(D-aspartate) O-methyltransferase [Thiohalocapsa marina]
MAMGSAPDSMTEQQRFAAERTQLINTVELEVYQTRDYLGFDRLRPTIAKALRRVPREQFVPRYLRGEAYGNYPLPIGDGQTISQPYIVAVMTHLANVAAGDHVYELGTGSGYQAAVLAEMGAEVYSVEIVPELAQRAAATLRALGYGNAHVRAGDGYLGWPEAAPFDAMLVTAAHPEIPQPLVEQLKVGGRLVMPLGGRDAIQQLTVLEKQPDGRLTQRQLLPVRFVPVTGPEAARRDAWP